VFQVAQCPEAWLFEFADPALVNFLKRHRVEEVQLLAAAPVHDDEVCPFEQREVLGDALPRHGQMLAKLAQGLAVMGVQPVQELPAPWIGQRLEQQISVGHAPKYASKHLHVKRDEQTFRSQTLPRRLGSPSHPSWEAVRSRGGLPKPSLGCAGQQGGQGLDSERGTARLPRGSRARSRGGYAAVVPAFPGCNSQGETAEEALSNAREAILLTIEDPRERGDAIPDPAGDSCTAWRSERSVAGAPARIGPRSGSRVAAAGYELVRQRGGHLRLRHPTNTRQARTGPDHADLKTGLLRALIRDAGTSIEELAEALRR